MATLIAKAVFYLNGLMWIPFILALTSMMILLALNIPIDHRAKMQYDDAPGHVIGNDDPNPGGDADVDTSEYPPINGESFDDYANGTARLIRIQSYFVHAMIASVAYWTL